MLDLTKDAMPPDLDEHRVLVVDNIPIIHKALVDMLRDSTDIHIEICADYQELNDIIASFRPSVILFGRITDAVIDFSIIEKLNRQVFSSDIPIVVMTTVEKPEDKKQSFKSGASDFIIKFPDVIELEARIRHHSGSHLKGLQRDFAFRALRVTQQQLLDTNLVLQRQANELERSNEALKVMASLDGLTSIANRATFDSYLAGFWNNPATCDSHISLLMIDVDYFKKYNDSFGHVEGDETLKRVASVLSSLVRDREHLAARYGGEEFCLVLPNTHSDIAITIANDLVNHMQYLRIPHNHPSDDSIVTLSIGVATMIPKNYEAPIELVKKADESLYEAKLAGRNRAISNTYNHNV